MIRSAPQPALHAWIELKAGAGKGAESFADGIILDLEDLVAPTPGAGLRPDRQGGRGKGFWQARGVDPQASTRWIRRGGSTTSLMAGKAQPDGILVPKTQRRVTSMPLPIALSEIDAYISIRVWAMIETARAVLDADKLAAASKDPGTRLAGFVFGPNDISRETRIKMQLCRAAMIPMITHCILATPRAWPEILDGPYSDLRMSTALPPNARRAATSADGKTLIHPGQIDACNAIFTPPAEEIAEARKIIAASSSW